MDSIPESPCPKCGGPRYREGHAPRCRACRNAAKRLPPNREKKPRKKRAYPPTTRCTKCGVLKTAENTGKSSFACDGLREQCKACRGPAGAAYMRQKRAADPALAQKKSRESARSRRALNPERAREANRRWYRSHPEQMQANNKRVKAMRRGVPGMHTLAEWRALKARYDHRCLCCGKSEPEIVLTEDHVIPVSKGGSNDISNIQPLCLACNCSKGNRHVTDYRP